MHTKQYTRQVEKRKRIGNRTLVVGMDIGSEFNAVCLMDEDGVVLGFYPNHHEDPTAHSRTPESPTQVHFL